MSIDETISRLVLTAQRGGVPEERVGQNCGFVVTVRAAVKRQLVLANHVVYRADVTWNRWNFGSMPCHATTSS
jgi:hypothetical protein